MENFLYVAVYVMLVCALVFFLKVSPSRKKNYNKKKMTECIKQGDYVLLENGIYGCISNINEDSFIIDIAEYGNGMKIKVSKDAVKTVITEGKE